MISSESLSKHPENNYPDDSGWWMYTCTQDNDCNCCWCEENFYYPDCPD